MRILRSIDWWIVGVVLILMAVGLIAIFSITRGTDRAIDFWKQIIFVAIAVAAIIGGAKFEYRGLRTANRLLLSSYGIVIGLLAGLFFFGDPVRGVRSWFALGPINVQPSELAKIVVVVLLAKYFSLRNLELYRLRHIVISGLYAGIPALLILLQPDAGSALIVAALWLGMVVVSGIRLRVFIILLVLLAIIGGGLWMTVIHDYQKGRILSFMNPSEDLLGVGYQRRQAVIAIGSGQVLGYGVGEGPQSQSGALPEAHTDFIFASIAEEWGFVGAMAIIALYLILILRLLQHAARAPNNFARLSLAGIALLFAVQFAINVSVNLGLLPIIGLPLPFVSYGGSNLLISAAAIGGAQSIIIRS